jgi:hypothetical protein
VRRLLLTILGAIPAGLLLGVATQGADHVHPGLRWVGGLGVPWLLVAFAVGALARGRVAGAAGGATALVVATGAWYSLHVVARESLQVIPVALTWAVAAVACGAVFGFLGAHWRAGHVAPVALLAGAFAGEALVLAAEWPRHVAATVLAAELAVAAVLPFLLTRPARAIPLVVALTAAATVAMGVATEEVRAMARAAGWRGL